MKKQRIFSFFLTLTILFSGLFTGSSATADPPSESDTLDSISQNWINSHYDGNAEVSSIIPVYVSETQLGGYMISFLQNGNPA